jgi:MGT family glycosyltransferase
MDLRPRASEPPGVPLVYACFGTSFNRRPKQFTSVIEAVAEEPVEVVVSMGAGTIAAETLGALPGNVTVKEFVDAREVLSRASVHITHGGCNSVHESLLAGVPMLCIPQGYDQFPLTSRIAALGAGRVVLEDADAIRAGVHWLLDDEAPTRRARELGSHLAGYDGERRVADVFEAVLESAAIEV